MESIKKLRKYADGFVTVQTHDDLMGLIDQIEAEIAERYMELPTDADGVPIHVGDLLQLGDTRSEVMAFEYRPHDKLPWSWLTKDGEWYSTAFTQHVKPRTIEDVLRDFLLESDCNFKTLDDVIIPKYAAEIRELLGVGE